MEDGALFAMAGVVPAFLAGAVAGRLPQAVLTAAFAVIAALAAPRMLRPSAAEPPDRVHPGRAAGSGAGPGTVTGFLGVGGGFLVVPALVSVLGLRMRRAVGTSLLVITVNSLAALAARTGTGGGLHWEVSGPFTGAAVLGAWDGKRLAAKISCTTLQLTALLDVGQALLAAGRSRDREPHPAQCVQGGDLLKATTSSQPRPSLINPDHPREPRPRAQHSHLRDRPQFCSRQIKPPTNSARH